MGCVNGKCCSRYPRSSEGDSPDYREVGPYGAQRKHILTERSIEYASLPSHNFQLEYSVLTHRGYYPDSLDKQNQDSFCIRTQVQGNPNVHFYGVFDGHGQFGTECSNFVKDRLVKILENDPTLLDDPLKAYNSAFLATNDELHKSEIDDSMSGTTAINMLVIGDSLVVANVGDSRAVVAVKDGNQIVAQDLSCDQTPFRKDECERVKLCGARVLSVDQVEGLKDPDIQSWGDEETEGNDPPRLWLTNGLYPGTAFTRSVGDSTAESIGVVADPEVSIVQLTPNHLFFVAASDGVFEFLSSQDVVNMAAPLLPWTSLVRRPFPVLLKAARYTDPRDACAAIVGESYKLWLEHENRTDDITIIIVHVKGLNKSAEDVVDGSSGINSKPEIKISKATSERSFGSGSEFYRSVRSDSSDLHSCQYLVSSNRSPAIIVPSLTRRSPLEGVGLSRYYDLICNCLQRIGPLRFM